MAAVIAAVITALIVICLVLLAGCAGLMWRVREQREDIDLVTHKLIEVLEERDVGRLPPGYPG